ncbi:hypothetical protein D6833_05700 [Candidatus Parcubacteria bacterium]|nr:MAG: hypothetical protein D6833_05700 [Candidatus Parcubacteria bacterium]
MKGQKEQPLLTLFTTPKPFDREHIALIQRNAIRSWLALGPEVEVLLIGDEKGVAEVAREFNIQHVPEVTRGVHGTPLIPSLFEQARRHGRAPFFAYVNADIVLTSSLLTALRVVASQMPFFLLVGQRWDLDVREPLAFEQGWEARLRAWVSREGVLHSRAGLDFFVFPRDLFVEIPPLVVGRAGWDNWMIYHAREQGWPVVDVSSEVLVVHQNHDYAHLQIAAGERPYWHEGAQYNITIAGGLHRMYTLWEASHELCEERVRRRRASLGALIHRVELALQGRGFPHRGWRRIALRRLRRLRFALERWEAARRRPPE